MQNHICKCLCKYFLVGVFLFVCSCLEEDRPDPGKITETFLKYGKKVSYFNPKNIETERIQIFENNKKRLYRVLSRKHATENFQDTKPIHCLLVAIDNYKDEPLRCCRKDMQELQSYLRKHFAAYNQEVEIHTLFDKKATRRNVLHFLATQAKKAKHYSTTFFAFSGHGTAEGLSMYDKEVRNSELVYYFKKIQSRRVIWLVDSCSAGAIALDRIGTKYRSKAKRSVSPLFPSPSNYNFLHCFLGQGKLIICSSLPHQESKDGIFTRALVSHLKALEDSSSLVGVIDGIKSGIDKHNSVCLPEYKLGMTPFTRLYGDIRVAVVPFPNKKCQEIEKIQKKKSLSEK